MPAAAPRNRLLAALSPSDLAQLAPHLRRVKLPIRTDMELPNRRIDAVYFIEAGIASVVAEEHDETRVEVGLIGREGMTGISVLLGASQTPHHTYMQMGGDGQRITASALRAAVTANKTLAEVFLRYVHIFMMQNSHTAIANARSTLNRRLARWILMAHDRTNDDRLGLTHEFLSLMLGVRRAGVTETLQALKRQQLIETGRNLIVVVDRKGLEKVAGAAYGTPEQEYRRLIGQL